MKSSSDCTGSLRGCMYGAVLFLVQSVFLSAVLASPQKTEPNMDAVRIFQTRQNVSMVLERIRMARDGFLRILWISEVPEGSEGQRYAGWLESLYGSLQAEQDDLEALDRELLRLAVHADDAEVLALYAETGIWDRVKHAEGTLDFLSEHGQQGTDSFDPAPRAAAGTMNTVDDTFQDISAFLAYQQEKSKTGGSSLPFENPEVWGRASGTDGDAANSSAVLRAWLYPPISGVLVQTFQPDAAQPVRGLGFAADDLAVHAAAAGRIIFSGPLRGAGWVLVLRHNAPMYTLYAYLEQSSLRKGDLVARGELLGRAGYYPPAQGLGLYFELRFGQKAINPQKWLRPGT